MRVVKVEWGEGKGKSYDSGRPDGRVMSGRDRPSKRTELGWKPTCSHEAEVVPATVCDMFMGSGTTGAVALRLGRNFIGIELSATYIKLAEKRIGAVNPLFAWRSQ